jgi:hypothetical protein
MSTAALPQSPKNDGNSLGGCLAVAAPALFLFWCAVQCDGAWVLQGVFCLLGLGWFVGGAHLIHK